MDITQYQIVLVNLDPTIGSEIKKTRPCLIISPDEMNQFLQTVIIAPVTSQSKPYPTRVAIHSPTTRGWVVLDQIRTIDKQRIVNSFGHISRDEIAKVKATLKELLVD